MGALTGSPLPNQPSGGTSTTTQPQYIQQLIYQLVNQANALGQQPYTPQPFNPVAPPSQQTVQGWQMANNNVGNWQPALGTSGALALSGATPLTTDTINNYANGYGSGVSDLTGQFGGVLGDTSTGLTSEYAPQYSKNLTSQQQQYMSGYTPQLLDTTNSVTDNQNKAVQGQIKNYLSPYLDTVASGIEGQLNKNFKENILPALQDRMVQSGQVASPQQMHNEDNAIYNEQLALGQALAPVYQQGYTGALTAAQQAATQGLNAGQSGVQSTYNLGAQGAGLVQNLGASGGTSAMGAGQYGYGLGTTTATGQQDKQLTAAQLYNTIANTNSNLTGQDQSRVNTAGSAQDTFNQKNVDANTANWNAQQNYPWQQITKEQQVLNGLPNQSSSQTVNVGASQGFNPSAFASALQTFLAAQGLAKGGKVKHKHGALAQYHRAY